MNKEKYLPIGSVVILQNGTKRIMISGYCAKQGNTMYDYIGILFPEGIVSLDKTLVFNHDQISQLFFTGLVDEEQKAFIEKLKEAVEKEDNKSAINSTNDNNGTLAPVITNY